MASVTFGPSTVLVNSLGAEVVRGDDSGPTARFQLLDLALSLGDDDRTTAATALAIELGVTEADPAVLAFRVSVAGLLIRTTDTEAVVTLSAGSSARSLEWPLYSTGWEWPAPPPDEDGLPSLSRSDAAFLLECTTSRLETLPFTTFPIGVTAQARLAGPGTNLLLRLEAIDVIALADPAA